MKHSLKLINNKGLTLIEVIITLAILSIIIGVIFSLLTFNLKLFEKGDNLSKVQFNIRMASDYVTSELRNAKTISLTDTTLLKTIDINVLSNRYPSVKNASFQIKNQGEHYLVFFIVQGSDSKSENGYQLESEVMLNNVTGAVLGSGTVLHFEKQY